jgi:hypothetical protein
MKTFLFATIATLISLNSFALDCEISTDKNGDGNYDDLVRSVPNVTHKDMIFIFKDGSTHREEGVEIGNEKLFTLKNSSNKGLDGSKIIAFGTQGSVVAVVARHVAGTQQDFESLSAGIFDLNAPFGVILDYTTKLKVACFK